MLKKRFCIDHPHTNVFPRTPVVKLKPMYSFGKWWKLKISLMGFVYRVVWVLKALWIFMSETINFLRKLQFLGCLRKFYHRVMYRAPSSGQISLNFNIPIKLILRKFAVVFWYLEWECCTFLKYWCKFIQIHKYYTMALLSGLSIEDARWSLPVQRLWFISRNENKGQLSSASSYAFERSSHSDGKRSPRIRQNSIWKHLMTTMC